MPIKVNGATSGSVTLAAPNAGSDVTTTLPNTTVDLSTSFGAWVGYSPNVGGVTLNNGSATGAYSKAGKTVSFWAQLGIGSTTAFTGNIWLGLPFTANSQYAFQATLYDSSTGTFYAIWCYGSNNAAEFFGINTAGTYGTLAYASSTVPLALATSDRFYVSGTYEAV